MTAIDDVHVARLEAGGDVRLLQPLQQALVQLAIGVDLAFEDVVLNRRLVQLLGKLVLRGDRAGQPFAMRVRHVELHLRLSKGAALLIGQLLVDFGELLVEAQHLRPLRSEPGGGGREFLLDVGPTGVEFAHDLGLELFREALDRRVAQFFVLVRQ